MKKTRIIYLIFIMVFLAGLLLACQSQEGLRKRQPLIWQWLGNILSLKLPFLVRWRHLERKCPGWHGAAIT